MIAKGLFGLFIVSQVVMGLIAFALPIWIARGGEVLEAWAWLF